MVKVKELCDVPDCHAQARTKGLCYAHWQSPHKANLAPKGYCHINNCSTAVRAAGKCSRHYMMKHRYNLSNSKIEELESITHCQICGVERNSGFAIDHDHSCCPERSKSCGKCVRGIICIGCNCAIERLDMPGWEELARKYLR